MQKDVFKHIPYRYYLLLFTLHLPNKPTTKIMEPIKMHFDKQKLRNYHKMSNEFISSCDMKVFIDELMDETIVSFDGWFYSNMADKKELIHYCDRPTFLDWLLRRKRKVVINVEAHDLLLNPPILPKETARIYKIYEDENSNR